MKARWLAFAALLSTAAVADVNQRLADARKHLDEVDYPAAAADLVLARGELGNDRVVTVEIRVLQGVIAAQMKKPEVARDFFLEALTIDPEKRLSGSYSPRVKAPFAEALKEIGLRGPLKVFAAPPVLFNGRVQGLKVRVENDAQGLVTAVRFHYRAGGSWQVKGVPAGLEATLPVDEEHLEWWAEALGDHESVLELVGTPATPLAIGDAPALAGLPPPPPPPSAPAPASAPPAAVAVAPTPIRITSTRVVAIGMGGLAVASLATGIAFGVKAQNERAQWLSAPLDAAGLVNTISQRDAFALDLQAARDSRVANSCYIGAGVVAIVTVVLWWLGAPAETPVAAGAPALSMRFP